MSRYFKYTVVQATSNCLESSNDTFSSSAPSAMPPSLVTLGDASLTVEDLALLVPPAWLNDHIISFWFEHLRIHILNNDNRVALLLPNLVFFLSLTHDEQELEHIARVHALSRRQLIILPVNDSDQAQLSKSSTPSGSHWTLLVFERASNKCFYLDSMPSRYRFVPDHLVDRLRSLAGASDAQLVHLSVQRQTNFYDCGAYVCIHAEEIIKNFLQGLLVDKVSRISHDLTPEQVDIKRQDIGRLACRLVDQRHKSGKTPSS